MNFYIKPQPWFLSIFYGYVVSYWISTSNHNFGIIRNSRFIVVSYWISTSNHNRKFRTSIVLKLYLIEFLHQTTTSGRSWLAQIGLYLIEFLHQTTTLIDGIDSSFELYLIEFLHQTTTDICYVRDRFCCILLNFYIKPQLFPSFYTSLYVVSYWISTSNHNKEERVEIHGLLYLIEFLHQTTTDWRISLRAWSCILLNFYIKPQLNVDQRSARTCCILLNFYIKPQLAPGSIAPSWVVSYWISTSNHNKNRVFIDNDRLYLIEFLHQTTTSLERIVNASSCILLNFYIKPQQSSREINWHSGCILLNFYIKPQQPTSRHGLFSCCILLNFYIKPQLTTGLSRSSNRCILLNFYIKPQRYFMRFRYLRGCILLNFYIKPQHSPQKGLLHSVVSYWISTSNHNNLAAYGSRWNVVSYWISTSNHNPSTFPPQVLSVVSYLNFYIKPQLQIFLLLSTKSCILLNFYIKPQRLLILVFVYWVVSYWISTSNHNQRPI